ncbi:manganese catalase family protein [Alkaliphilus serpentinus]|uniref:Uncharacterized protein n=1 Tax=Alkaliphilus serpentinus TaxID=1482731 RepID=A0A833M8M9_9FIRM|nr:hypothetical protein F8153_15690 [Alkaliphilus serpentinus]
MVIRIRLKLKNNGSLYYADPNRVPWTSAYIQAHADPVADLHEDMAAEQKARATYEHLLKLAEDTR